MINVRTRALVLLAFAASLCMGPTATLADDFNNRRLKMVATQIRGRGISDVVVLKAMATVPRHLFVPPELRDLAYGDRPLPIGHGQTISQPYIVALMSQLLSVQSGQRVLEIGTGSGYQAAVLAEMGVLVFSIEIVPQLGRQAARVLNRLEFNNIQVKIGDGYKGWPKHAPFNAIIVTCAPTRIPEPLTEQLIEGGRMVIPSGEKYNQQLLLLTKHKGKIKQEKVIDVRFVPMVDQQGRTY